MNIVSAIIMLVILLFSAILHEIAHGFVADRLGDPTARLMGRLTLDPRKHIDPMMSIALPLILLISGSPIIFGAAKPIPVDSFNLRDGRKDLALVSLAGPGTNLVLAIFFASICHFLFPNLSLGEVMDSGFLGLVLGTAVYMNLLLAIFNLIPIPPLDGSKIFSLLLPEKMANTFMSLGSIGFIIIFFLLMSPGTLSLGSTVYSLLSFSVKLLGL